MTRCQIGALGLGTALSGGLYVGVSFAMGYLGFPLDDAWIHQTYARNLAELGQFAFIPGQPSAGSTSPLWSALLAVGYLLRIEPRLWAYGLGCAALWLTAYLGYRLIQAFLPESPKWAFVGGLLIVSDWHLGWAAVSGMETVVFAALALAVFVVQSPILLGVCVGLSVLARPDGLLLLPIALARAGLAHPAARWKAVGQCGLMFSALFGGYLTFNYAIAGSIWPNTFYAKQAEYAIYQQLPLWTRFGQVGLQPFVGALALLLPGIGWAVWRSVAKRDVMLILLLGWVGAFITSYALRLPVTYQHGRYLIPVIPVLVVLGSVGLARLLRPQAERLLPRVVSRVWVVAMPTLALVFCGLGATTYGRDVRIIETEMVQTARWIATNTLPTDLIAAHDIGALGYFAPRPLLDLAGLVSPEVIPFIRDEARLRVWLTERQATYLVTFPNWYPALTASLDSPLYTTHAPYSPQAGGENMAVYRWP